MGERSNGMAVLKCLFLAVIGTSGLLWGKPAAAYWDGAVVGTISAVEVTHGENFGFRIYLNGISNMCSGGPGWAYVNESDSNYKVYVAALMMAKAQGNSVTVYTLRDANNYCHIGHVSVGN